MNGFVVNTSDTYYLNDIYGDIDVLCVKYNTILKKKVIGKSIEGRNIIALKLSHNITNKDEILHCSKNDINRNNIISSSQNDTKRNNSNNSKPSVLFVGGIHAREDFSVMLCMKMIDYYCNYYIERKSFGGYDLKNIIDNVNMHFIPVANPDGLNIVHNGLGSSLNYDKLKDMKIWGEDHTYWKANANGVDLNKNFDDGNWDIRLCVSGTDIPCSDRFKGFYPNSEPETKALINYCKENHFSLMATYHCSGNCTFWADSGTHSIFNGLDEKIIDEFNKKFIYRKTKVSADPVVYGCGFENWFRAKMRRPAFCIELSPFIEGGKQHPDCLFDELVWQHGKLTGLFFAEKAIEVYNEIYSNVEKYAALTE